MMRDVSAPNAHEPIIDTFNRARNENKCVEIKIDYLGDQNIGLEALQMLTLRLAAYIALVIIACGVGMQILSGDVNWLLLGIVTVVFVVGTLINERKTGDS